MFLHNQLCVITEDWNTCLNPPRGTGENLIMMIGHGQHHGQLSTDICILQVYKHSTLTKNVRFRKCKVSFNYLQLTDDQNADCS